MKLRVMFKTLVIGLLKFMNHVVCFGEVETLVGVHGIETLPVLSIAWFETLGYCLAP